MNVLLLEDDPQNTKALKQVILTACPQANITALAAVGENFYYGNDMVKLSAFDAVITDVNMPGYTDNDGMTMGSVGNLIALKAFQQGVKRIAVLTDANHHEANPVSKGADLFMDFNVGEGDCVAGDVRFIYRNVSKTYIHGLTRVMQWLFSEGGQRYTEWAKENPS